MTAQEGAFYFGDRRRRPAPSGHNEEAGSSPGPRRSSRWRSARPCASVGYALRRDRHWKLRGPNISAPRTPAEAVAKELGIPSQKLASRQVQPPSPCSTTPGDGGRATSLDDKHPHVVDGLMISAFAKAALTLGGLVTRSAPSTRHLHSAPATHAGRSADRKLSRRQGAVTGYLDDPLSSCKPCSTVRGDVAPEWAGAAPRR